MSGRFYRLFEDACASSGANRDLVSVIAARQVWCLRELNYGSMMDERQYGACLVGFEQIMEVLTRHLARLVAIDAHHQAGHTPTYKIGQIVTKSHMAAMVELHRNAIDVVEKLTKAQTRACDASRGFAPRPSPPVVAAAEDVHVAIEVVQHRMTEWYNAAPAGNALPQLPVFDPSTITALLRVGSAQANATTRIARIAAMTVADMDKFSLSSLVVVV